MAAVVTVVVLVNDGEGVARLLGCSLAMRIPRHRYTSSECQRAYHERTAVNKKKKAM